LTAGIVSVLKSQPSTGALAAKKLALEYDKYCKTAMAPPALPIFTGVEAMSLEGPLAAVFSGGTGPAPAVAQAWATGIQAYWLAPPVMFVGGPVSGVATAMPGAPASIAPITAALTNLGNTEETFAQQLATALDIATKTVLVTFATPPPPAGPPPPALVM
jgi:hypothetical protein